MPTAHSDDGDGDDDGVELYYETSGDGEPVVFVSDAGLGAWVWGWQFRSIAGPYEAVTWDLRGTGRSDAPPGSYTVATLADDLRTVLGDAGVGRPHLVGLGLGGQVALAYAFGETAAGDRSGVRSLALLGSAASGAAIDRATYEHALAGTDDPAALRAALSTLCTPAFLETQPDVVDGIVQWRRDDDAGERGRAAQLAAFEGFDVTDRLHELTAPALVVHGGADELVPSAAGARLARDLPRGRYRAFEDAGHLVGVERSRPVNDALRAFLDEPSPGSGR